MEVAKNIKSVKIASEKDVSKEDIVAEACKIYKDSRERWNKINVVVKKGKGKKAGNSKMAASDVRDIEELYKRMCKEHPQFQQSYPTVLRHMVQENRFSINAFRKYMERVAARPWTNDNERMDSYTDYYIELLKDTMFKGKHVNTSTINAAKLDYRMRLQNEHDEFIQTYKDFDERQKKEKAEIETGKRKDLLNAFIRLAHTLNIDIEKRKNIVEMTESNKLPTAELERIVNSFYRLIHGEDPSVIRSEMEKSRADSFKEDLEKTDKRILTTPDMDDDAVANLHGMVKKFSAMDDE